jgi:hypothetical protein
MGSNAAFGAVTLLDPVPAADPGQLELDGMQDQCDAMADARDVDGLGTGDRWSAEVVLGAVTLTSGPTYIGSHSIDDAVGEPVGAGTFTPAGLYIVGYPYRNGGSVNMFGVQRSTGGSYSASTYDFMGVFETTYSHAFSCDIFMENYVPEHTIDHRAVGEYVFHDDGTGSDEEATRANCQQYTDNGQPWWGTMWRPNENNKRCKFEGTPAYTETVLEDWEDPVFVTNEAGVAISVEQEDDLLAHEDAGEGFSIGEDVLIGQVVVCISPSTSTKRGVPGAWVAKNGYLGDKCTTTWFNSGAMTGVDNLNLQGTFISVPLT